MQTAIERLKAHLQKVDGLRQAATVMAWDQKTHMPAGGAKSRARALATVSQMAHEMRTSPEYEALLREAEAMLSGLEPESDDARLLLMARRDFEKVGRLPGEFVAELNEKSSIATRVWQEAREENDYDRFAPHLEEMIGLQRRKIDFLGYEDHPYDALLDLFEPNMKTAQVRAIFRDLKARTVPLVAAINERQAAVDDHLLHRHYDLERQWELARRVTALFGYDYQHGRVDESAHPFCIPIAPSDTRITIRADENFFNSCFFAAAHECGHALYSQGFPEHFTGLPLARGASAAVHESQSRLWENLVARSRPFWRGFFPQVQAMFPEQLGGADAEQMYRAVNRAAPSPIRVEADEVTYNLHIMLRFDLEVAMLEGAIGVEELPQRWNEKMEEYLGIVPESDRDGVLQDTHWASGLYGYFPTYTLGNVLSVQFYETAAAALPDLSQQIEQGEMAPLLGWMREHVHRHGRKFFPQELAQKATGSPLEAGPYVDYLERKYADIYNL